MLRLMQIIIIIWVGAIHSYLVADTPGGRLILIETNRIKTLLKSSKNLDDIQESILKANCLIYLDKTRMSLHEAIRATASQKYSIEFTEDGHNYIIYFQPNFETKKLKQSAGELQLSNKFLIPANRTRSNLHSDPPNTHYFVTKNWSQKRYTVILENVNLKH